jgi:hypothetical protein
LWPRDPSDVTRPVSKEWRLHVACIRFIGNSDAAFGTSNAKQHAARRKAMSRFFSQSAILSLEDSVNRCVQRLCERVKEHQDAKTPVNLSNAYRCLAGDIVSQYSLPEGLHNLDLIDFANEYNRRARSLSYIAVWHRFLGFIIPLFLQAPRWMVVKISSKGALQAFDFQAVSTTFSPSCGLRSISNTLTLLLEPKTTSIPSRPRREEQNRREGR